jgi:hypothetical protein
MAVHCAICFNQGRLVDYETVVGGVAVCADHIELASRPDFSIWNLVVEKRAL